MKNRHKKTSAREPAGPAATPSRIDPEMDDLGEDYLAAAVVRLVQTDGQVQGAILDLICARLNAGRR